MQSKCGVIFYNELNTANPTPIDPKGYAKHKQNAEKVKIRQEICNQHPHSSQRSDLLVGGAEERSFLEAEVSLEEKSLLVDCWEFCCFRVNGPQEPSSAAILLDIAAMRGEDG